MHLVCPWCGAVNRVPPERLAEKPKCGRCACPVIDDKPAVLSAQSFERFVRDNELPVLVDFWAPWCGPCKAMAPVFETLAAELKTRVRFAKLDTDAHPTVAERFQVRSIPTLILFRGGDEMSRSAGAMDATRLRRWLAAALA